MISSFIFGIVLGFIIGIIVHDFIMFVKTKVKARRKAERMDGMKYIVFFYFIEKRRHPLKKEFDTQKEAEDYIEQGKKLDDFGGWCLEECEIER